MPKCYLCSRDMQEHRDPDHDKFVAMLWLNDDEQKYANVEC